MRIVLLLLLLTFSKSLVAQNFYGFKNQRDIILSFGTGTTTYFGDLKDNGDYIDPKLNLNVGLQYFFHPNISGRAELSYFRISGDDKDSDFEGKNLRNLSFRSDNIEFNVSAVIHAFPKGIKFYQRPTINPYAFVGIGALYFNPKAQVPATDWNGNPLPDAGKYIALQPLQTEGKSYNKLAIVIPFGAGFKYKLNPFLNLGLEGGYRLTFTDYLDDVSTVYKDHNSFGEDYLAQAMADRRHELSPPKSPLGLKTDQKRGNPDNNDGYFMLSIKIEYYLPPTFLSSHKNKRGKGRYKRAKRR
ncbi:DUF6089 family protein [Fulvivirga sediminis]|uniref:Outer membrane beta-barrel protein n=1 Tax=Fulvivirga sediminis TaxID=2803949 RepID=A0A937F7E8_9BACT|nr:DUF6089 family protein [Fulvivirga sediminis]MBL3655368.1 outer membrane beta-barrel protein [Fulvivirga sediminis]